MRYILIFLFIVFCNSVYAESFGKSTGYKIPRFVSTKSNESNFRIGANTDYPIELTYVLKNFPLEIIDEYEQWRKIIDIDGNVGWMHKSLLQGKRNGIIKTGHAQAAQIYNKPGVIIIGKIGNKNIVKINKCFSIWCHISIENKKGWANKNNIWGVYNNEEFNMPFYQKIINFYWKLI